jgi:uncharacterized phiE125 gp8 family phage protein
MSYVATPDYAALPAAMLTLAKQHMRVTWTDDDTVITEYLAQAIGLCEQFWGLAIFSTAVDWTPEPAGQASYQCPVQPVSAFTVTAGGTDVSADYQLAQAALTEPVFLKRKDGTAFPDDAEVTLSAGYATPSALMPPMRAGILRVTATLYENRESATAYTVDQMPFWLNDMLGGLWVPRA